MFIVTFLVKISAGIYILAMYIPFSDTTTIIDTKEFFFHNRCGKKTPKAQLFLTFTLSKKIRHNGLFIMR